MRKLLAGISLLLFGIWLSPQAAAQVVSLKGSDTLEDVVKAVIVDPGCALSGAFSYVGGGSSGGQSAMTASPPTQDIAPMSRELNGAACVVSANELLIGLDGIAIVGANQVAGDSEETLVPPLTGVNNPADDCRDAIRGDKSVAVADCSVVGSACDNGVVSGPGIYTFTSWRDVLAVVYAGQNHSAAAQLNADKTRNPARINCAGPVRQALVNNWGTIFSDTGAAQTCRTQSCNRLKHAFRRDDVSGTTDTFVGLIGLVPIPPYTTTSATNFPTKNPATATANPFCNAGGATMNKGDADYLDLDPIRRIADSEGVLPDNRAGREQVAQGYGPPVNPPAVLGSDTRADPPVAVLADFGAANRQNVGPDPNNAGWMAAQQTELPKRRGLGVVLPIAFPTNYNTADLAYWAPPAAGGAPVLCTPGVFAPTLPDTAPPGICPDGTTGLCNLPVNAANPATPNFNCMSLGAKPSNLPIQDERVYNLLVLTAGGKYVYDNYVNGSLALPATRQRRAVSGFYRLHTTRVTDFGGHPTGGPCALLTSATAIVGCLVKSNPCSIGFAGRESVDNVASMAFRLGTSAALNDAYAPSIARVNNLVTTADPSDDYGLARTLWVNTAVPANVTANENLLLNCFGQSGNTAIVDAKISQFNFVPVPAGVVRKQVGCPATFPGGGAAFLACQNGELASSRPSCDPAFLTATTDSSGNPVGWGFSTLSTFAQQNAGRSLIHCINVNNCSANATNTGPGSNPILGCFCGPGVGTGTTAATNCQSGTGVNGVCLAEYEAAATTSAGGPPAGSTLAAFASFITTAAFQPDTPVGLADNIKECAIDTGGTTASICGSL